MDNVLFPVRCVTCGYVLGRKQYPYENLINQGFSQEEAIDALGITRYCCRRHVLSPQVLPLGSLNMHTIESGMGNISIEPQRTTSIPNALTSLQNPAGLEISPPGPSGRTPITAAAAAARLPASTQVNSQQSNVSLLPPPPVPHSIILPRREELLRIPRTPNAISVTRENNKTYTLYYAV